MFLTKKHISRRAMLRGLGYGVGLPFLDAMVPAATALAQTAAAPKARMGFFYLGHRTLDSFVKKFRAKTIKTLSTLAPPKKD
jgi:hypothetical protein